MARPKNPYADIEKCKNNIGKDVRLTTRKGQVVEGTLWEVVYPEKWGDGKSIAICVKEWNRGLQRLTPRASPVGVVRFVHARFIVKFEYLWEETT